MAVPSFFDNAGSNIAMAAKAKGRVRSRESVEQGAAKLRGVPLSSDHAAHLWGNKFAAGVKMSDERKVAVSKFFTGRPHPKSPEYREKIAAGLRGRKATPEHRANQSAAQKGKKKGPYGPRSPETRARMAALRAVAGPSPLLGRKRSPETIAKMRAVATGKTPSASQRAKVSAASRAMWTDPDKRAQIVAAQKASRAKKRAAAEAATDDLPL